jgi:hypothetical protein
VKARQDNRLVTDARFNITTLKEWNSGTDMRALNPLDICQILLMIFIMRELARAAS